MEIKLTKAEVAKAPVPLYGQTVYSFRESSWLKLRVSCKGVRTWAYHRRDGGKLIRITLGRAEIMTPTEALERCLAIASGKEQASAEKSATLGDIMGQWIDSGQRSPAMKRHQLYYVRVLGDLCQRRISDLDRDTVQRWHADETRTRGATPSNNAMRAAKAAVNWALDKGLARGENPFRGVRQNKVEPRSRFMFGKELEKFKDGVARLDPRRQRNFCDFLGIMMRTGQRMGNICAMEWSEVDFERREWTIPAGKYKSRRSHTVPLVDVVVELLERRRKTVTGRWVFPSRSVEGHSLTFICQLRRLCRKLGIKNLTQHDLRRTVASSLINDGVPLQTVMAVLGHTSAQTSLVYARIADQSKRTALERL